jgi:hypothetical protein
LWHLENYFLNLENGVEITDIPHCKLPFEWLGEGPNSHLIHRRFEEFFTCRGKKHRQISPGILMAKG